MTNITHEEHREVYLMLYLGLNGKDLKEEGIFAYMRLMHFTMQLKLTQPCKATTLQ